LIAGAANTTTGNITNQATSQDNSQWPTNSIGVGEGKLAIPAAIKLVSPAWRTPKMKWLYLRGMPNMGEAALCKRLAALNLSPLARGSDHAFGRQGDSTRFRDIMGHLPTRRWYSQYDLAQLRAGVSLVMRINLPRLSSRHWHGFGCYWGALRLG
jgi:hypothetical protein